MSKTDFHKVRGVADVINVSFEFTKENLKELIKCVAYISGPFILAGSAVYGYFMYSTYTRAFRNLAIEGAEDMPSGTSMAIEVFLMIFTLMLAYFLFYSAVYEYINLY